MTLGNRIQSFRKAAGLDPNAPLVANMELSRGWENSLPTLAFQLTAAQVNEDLKVTFLISTRGGQPAEVEGRRAGAVFSGSYSYQKDYLCPDTITAVFDDGVRQYSRVLIRNLSIVDGGASWEPMWMDAPAG